MLSIEFTNGNQQNKQGCQEVNNLLLTSSKELKTDAGFISSYYKILSYFNSQESAFLYINVLHFKKYNSFKFCSYKEFKKFKNKTFKDWGNVNIDV